MAKLNIYADRPLSTIAPEIYGHFSEHLGRCIYEGIYVGENSDIPNVNGMRCDVVEALKQIRIPVLRWPGGCFADEYHWKDGIGPKEQRKKMINTHWGGVVEDNSFGTHEFFELCRQLGCKTYVNGNVGSGTVQEMAEWVEYMTFDGVSPMADLRRANGQEKPWKVDYFGIGNENWGCGGNMLPEYYANEYRRYRTYVRDFQEGHRIDRICGGANVADYEWTEKVLETCFRRTPPECHGKMDGLSLHYYVHPEGWEIKGSATEFDDDVFYKTLSKAWYMDELIRKHGTIMDKYDPEKRVGMIVDEWGAWYTVEPGTNPGFLYQQNTMRDALVAGITLNIFNNHSDRVKMANLAQMVNVLQAVLLTDGAKMIKTPTYHVFDLFQHHQNGTLVDTCLETAQVGTADWQVPQISQSVSKDENGTLHLTLANASNTEAATLEVHLFGTTARTVTGRMLHGEMHQRNTFDAPETVTLEALPAIAMGEGGFTVTLPPCTVAHVQVQA